MGQERKDGGGKKEEAGRLSFLRKYIPTPEDAAIVKEMIKDGLSDDDILHALGYVTGAPSRGVLPNGHDHSNQLTSEQQEKEAQAAEAGGPGGGMDGDSGGEDGGNDMLTHVAGLLNHVAKGKAKDGVKGGAAG